MLYRVECNSGTYVEETEDLQNLLLTLKMIIENPDKFTYPIISTELNNDN